MSESDLKLLRGDQDMFSSWSSPQAEKVFGLNRWGTVSRILVLLYFIPPPPHGFWVSPYPKSPPLDFYILWFWVLAQSLEGFGELFS